MLFNTPLQCIIVVMHSWVYFAPIMPAFCSFLFVSCYSKKIPGKIGSSLPPAYTLLGKALMTNYKSELPGLNFMPKVIMLAIPCIILFRISCNYTLYSEFHALFSKLFSRSLSKQFRSSQNDILLQSMTTLLE